MRRQHVDDGCLLFLHAFFFSLMYLLLFRAFFPFIRSIHACCLESFFFYPRIVDCYRCLFSWAIVMPSSSMRIHSNASRLVRIFCCCFWGGAFENGRLLCSNNIIHCVYFVHFTFWYTFFLIILIKKNK